MPKTIVAIVLLATGALAGAGVRTSGAAAQLVPNGADLRFRLVGDEPVAGPDGNSVVNGWKVLVFKDMKSGQCYFTFTSTNGMGVANAAPCPR